MRNALCWQLDEMVDAYVDWREACVLVSDAYRSWQRATGADLTPAFVWYMATLDHEERAAETYARLVRCVSDLAAAEHAPSATLAR